MLEMPDDSVEFVLIAEAGVLEDQALLLCESIRRFAGRYARCPITVISPRSHRRPSQESVRGFEKFGVDYLPIEIESCCPQYGSSYRVHGLAYAERRPGPAIVVQLDSDTIFVSEPDLVLEEHSLAARPVDAKGMCTTGPGDVFDPYWQKLCRLIGVDYDALPLVQTTAGQQTVRASYNSGLVAARRSCGIFASTEEIFRRLVAADMQPWADGGPTISTGTGVLYGAATAFWGTSQVAISLAAVAGGHSVRLLPATHNFPMNMIDQLTRPFPPRLAHLHYHELFFAEHAASNPVFDGRLDLPAEITAWLRERLPLPVRTTRAPAREAASGARPGPIRNSRWVPPLRWIGQRLPWN